MAKIVSTKFGDRRLIYLPPINVTGNKTPNVETIEMDRQVPDRHGNAGSLSVVPKEYAYKERPLGRKNAWLGAPVRSTLEGNIVSEHPRAAGDQIFQQLYQQASTNTMANYGQGQYPVLPPVGETPHYMQYTSAGLQPLAQQQQQQQPPPAPQSYQAGQSQPQGPSCVPQPGIPQHSQGCNPNEKHIYYGPNNEILPGPPSVGHGGAREILKDFAFEGVLHFGRLRTITLIESVSGFPRIPDFLIKDLIEKYGQFEHTVVRVVARLGRCYVHATPQISPRVQAEYVPVYLDEDEEFDYDRFISKYKSGEYPVGNRFRGQWRSQYPLKDREIVYSRDIRPDTYGNLENVRRRTDDDRYRTVRKDREIDYSRDIRPNTYDNFENVVWRKNDDQYRTGRKEREVVYSRDIRPNTYDNLENVRWGKDDDRYRTARRRRVPSRAETWAYRSDSRRALQTRPDIKPIGKLDRRLLNRTGF